ncbi:hypothetical protein Kintu_gp19 [Xanthomonas phage Kintu]
MAGGGKIYLSYPARAIVRRPPPFGVIYLDTEAFVNGSGSRESPFNSINSALIAADGFQGMRIKIFSRPNTPIRSEIIYTSSFDIEIEGVDGLPWYAFASSLHTSGWSDMGAGIYSKSIGTTAIGRPCVLTLSQTVGDRSDWFYKLIPSEDPLNPQAGQYGYSGGVTYIRLPDSSNPNSHSIEIPVRNNCVSAVGSGRVTIRNLVGRFAINAITSVGRSTQATGTGYMTIEDSLLEYGGGAGGAAASGKFESLVCRNVRAYRADNDGFNIHALVPDGAACHAELFGCEGSYNGDIFESSQGASAHEGCRMDIHGGRFNFNVSGGMYSIDSSVNNLYGDGEFGPIEMTGNMRNVPFGVDPGRFLGLQAACGWGGQSSGLVLGHVRVTRNNWRGVKVETPGNVAGVDQIISEDNGAPDSI